MCISELRERESGEAGSVMGDCSEIEVKGGNVKNKKSDSGIRRKTPSKGIEPLETK